MNTKFLSIAALALCASTGHDHSTVQSIRLRATQEVVNEGSERQHENEVSAQPETTFLKDRRAKREKNHSVTRKTKIASVIGGIFKSWRNWRNSKQQKLWDEEFNLRVKTKELANTIRRLRKQLSASLRGMTTIEEITSDHPARIIARTIKVNECAIMVNDQRLANLGLTQTLRSTKDLAIARPTQEQRGVAKLVPLKSTEEGILEEVLASNRADELRQQSLAERRDALRK